MLPVLSNTTNCTNKTNNNNNNHQHSSSSSSNQKNSSSLKRTASMIFRIEHLLPSTSNSNSSNSSNGSSSLQAQQKQQQQQDQEHKNIAKRKRNSAQMNNAGVFVSQFTPKGSLTEFLSPVALMSISCATDMKEQQQQQQQQKQRVFCNLSEGVLCMTAHILRQIRLADDIHSYNAIMELHKGQVRLRIVQDLCEDDEIIVWFCEQMSILMSIPFLTLQNIQGDKQYTCHVCQRNFETPHPLKLHLALACDRNTIDMLYIRLYYAVTFNQQQQMLGSVSSTISLTTSTMNNVQEERYSAFKPIKSTIVAATATPTTPIFTTSNNTCSTHTATSLLSAMPAPISFLPNMNMELTGNSTSTINAAAQIEAIVSNMGASKRGHLCLYCGKCYSRKYGLKIHIRTHTGFKPLKCKFCLRPFGDPSNLNKHVRLHLQTNAITVRTDVHKCHLCHKALARRRDLQRHLESRHAGETI